ncbi:DUF1513 domain-containing protein [Fluviibacterium sp. S390]|uniref:DUF1513 domain-containing protein n=1 Tax=Fluviibacterium sp. S390 TaxID=3415139 RepID=UPI003C7D22C5
MRRRSFLALSAAALATPAWSATTARFVTAASRPDKSTWLVGLSDSAEVLFQIPIPSRGHAAATHPLQAQAVAFARRPGRFAVILDCLSGRETARLSAPEGRHFYGHGAFTADGRYLLTTENDYDGPDGRIGIWDATAGYRRVDEVPSGGIGPHEIRRLPDGGFAVANGGIQTHPDFQRAKLNLPTMQPNLTYLDPLGGIVEQVAPPAELHQNSIRHIDVDRAGRVVMALQWQGDPRQPVPLAASHRRGESLRFHPHPDTAKLRQYGGSVAVAGDGSEFAVTGPKGDHIVYFRGADAAPSGGDTLPQASGVAQMGDGLAITRTGGLTLRRNGRMFDLAGAENWTWDNHLVPI